MEIKDPVHGTLEFTPPEVAVIDSPAFQRLRSIKQLGFGEFSFPGATHNRYIHSLGASHLAGEIFDQIFRGYRFKSKETMWRLRQTLRLASLLHDIGHGPLSHTSEEVMPPLSELDIKVYPKKEIRRSNHEDYTIKFITDSPLTEVLKNNFPDISPLHIACLIDKTLKCPDDFFKDQDLDLRTILSQLVSSEMDCDRMDYLIRDSYFCGTNYGKFELTWLISNLTYHIEKNRVHLALNRRALYTFDDFLISRHHMYLMVYFHHKSIIYDEMLNKYLTSPECEYSLPSDINKYLNYTDHNLNEHLKKAKNEWAQRISKHTPYRVLFEVHTSGENDRPKKIRDTLKKNDITNIFVSSEARLSKYHSLSDEDSNRRIFVVDQYDRGSKPFPLEQGTEIFRMYEKARRIERIYVPPEEFVKAESLI
ncbi:MAG: HD domain-containing protein [Bdellovibrionales bacterium]